ncbi:Ceramide synthase 5 [Basidiobolus ranarum]|uniref:Ceramide synthase 5 n=1 Tax=Basidiobolus ranarum TaxID=34480 RepID=A0ABR2VN22_9FUNG
MTKLSFSDNFYFVVDEFRRYEWFSESPFQNVHLTSHRLKEDFTWVMYAIVAIAFAHFVAERFIFQPLAQYSLPAPKGSSIKGDKLSLKSTGSDNITPAQRKFNTACYKFVLYSSMSAYGFYALYDQPWALNGKALFENHPNQEFPDKLRIYHLIEMSHYIYAMAAFVWEPRLKDFYQMVFHHIVTMTLITFSYTAGLYRVGAVILLLHDVSDPLMEIAKLFFYTKHEKLSNAFFFLFATVFIYTRDYFFPTFAIYSVWHYGRNDDGSRVPYTMECLVFLSLLQTIHVFWSYLIVNMVVEAVAHNGVQGDTRDDKD